MREYIDLIRNYSKKDYTKMTRKPDGLLKYPFIVPGSVYANMLWDWDSYFTDVAVCQIMADNGKKDEDYIKCEEGCIKNFFELEKSDGRIPIGITPDHTLPRFDSDKETNIHKPCLAQHIAFIIARTGGFKWVEKYFDKLKLFLEYYRNHFLHKETGLFFWIDDMAIGVDNDPCTFYRPEKSSASIYLNCMMYKEYKAMEMICRLLKKDEKVYADYAENLKDTVNKYMWDERNGFYYNADLNLRKVDTENEWLHKGMPRHWSSLIQKIDVWSGFMALWSGIATKERAKRVIKENMFDEKTFMSNYGVRSLSKLEQMYLVVESNNPSCWLGPVWGISNYMCFKGLLNYGYENEAKILAEKLITLFGKDIKKCGQMHEYYDGETGEGISNEGFQSWDMLINNICAWYEKRETISEF